MGLHRVGEIDTSEDLAHERREWVVQRVAWAAMALFVATAASGLLGAGPLARAEARGAGFDVAYPRFARQEATDELTVRLAPGIPAEVWLARELLGSHEIEEVTPRPDSVTPRADRLVHRWASAGPAEVVFRLRPVRPGRHPIRLGVAGGGEVELHQLVYP